MSTTRRFVYTWLPINIPHTSRLGASNTRLSSHWCMLNPPLRNSISGPNARDETTGIGIYCPIDITILINAILVVNRRIPRVKKKAIIKLTISLHWVSVQLLEAAALVLNNSFPNTNLLRIAHLHG